MVSLWGLNEIVCMEGLRAEPEPRSDAQEAAGPGITVTLSAASPEQGRGDSGSQKGPVIQSPARKPRSMDGQSQGSFLG